MLEDVISWFVRDGNGLTAAQVAAALVTAAATIALWRVTQVLAKETSALAKMTSRPFVVSWLESSAADATALNLVLRNEGNATAFDIKLRLTPALPTPMGTPPENQAETVFELSLLPPGQVLPIQGVMARDVHGQNFAVTVSWSQMPAAKARESLSYNIAPQDGFRGGWGTKGIHQIAQELEKIRGQMKGLTRIM